MSIHLCKKCCLAVVTTLTHQVMAEGGGDDADSLLAVVPLLSDGSKDLNTLLQGNRLL